ncbi:hypothetical protein HDV06_004375 [Boothiomyces sp. JEL0866]|nr:hypothetical protein HDV06_004375 [Boothiomyces sp. JEL0866]
MTGILKKRKSNVVEADQKKSKVSDTKVAIINTQIKPVSPMSTNRSLRRSKRVGIINRPYRSQNEGEKRVQNTLKFIQNEISNRFESYFTFESSQMDLESSQFYASSQMSIDQEEIIPIAASAIKATPFHCDCGKTYVICPCACGFHSK